MRQILSKHIDVNFQYLNPMWVTKTKFSKKTIQRHDYLKILKVITPLHQIVW